MNHFLPSAFDYSTIQTQANFFKYVLDKPPQNFPPNYSLLIFWLTLFYSNFNCILGNNLNCYRLVLFENNL